MKSKYFKIQELVSDGVYKKYGDKSWEFIDDRLVETLDQLREFFGRPITVNNWYFGGNLSQRGYRANKDPMVNGKSGYYCSQHCMGRAVDFNVKDLSTQEVYNMIVDNIDKFPHIKRLEHIDTAKTWTHIDLSNTSKNELVIFRG